MKKNRSKKFMLAALTGLLLFAPAQNVYAVAGNAGQVSSSHDSKLSELDIAPGVLSPAFSPDVLEYTSTVDSGVTKVSVRAVPRAAGGTIAAVEGAKTLEPGVNTVKVTCSAQDNSYTVYSIAVTVGSTGTDTQPDTANDPVGAVEPNSTNDPAGTAEPNTANNPAGNASTNTAKGKSGKKKKSSNAQANNAKGTISPAPAAIVGPVAADGTVTLNDAAYKLSSNFSYSYVTQDIPSAFGQGSVQIAGNNYSTFYCEANGIHLVYMENTDGKGSTGFYYYDEKQNAVERFKYTGIGENFVVFISSPRADLPTGYTDKILTLPSGKDVMAYQNNASDQMEDYYLIYGINSDGSNGWYLYDNAQGTYMRYAEAFASAPDEAEVEEPIERTVSLNKYNLQVEKYKELKNNMVKAISAFVIAFLLLIIIFTAILFKSRDAEEETERVPKQPKRAKRNVKKTQKSRGELGKNSLEAGRILDRESAGPDAKKITKKILPEPQEERRSASINTQEHISTPEEIRKQMQQEQLAYEQAMNTKKSRSQKKQEQNVQANRPEMQPQQRNPLKREQPVSAPDSVQLAAEKMRQSMQFAHKSQKNTLQDGQQDAYGQPVSDKLPETSSHDPMDDWEVEDTIVKRKSRKKKRGRMDEDVKIMDLNDL